MNALGEASNPVRVVRLRPAFESFAGSGSGYVEVCLYLKVSESLQGVRLRLAFADFAHSGEASARQTSRVGTRLVKADGRG